jgi:two-component system response regulator PilR (NtrC family)
MVSKGSKSGARVLVVDDELSMRELLEIVLQNAGYQVSVANSPDAAIALLEQDRFDAVLTDLLMENDRLAGMRLLKWIQEYDANIPTVLMTAHGSVETAIEAMQLGATDYIQKPFKNDEIRLRIERSIAQRDLKRENTALRTDQVNTARIENMIGASPAFHEVISMVRRVASLPSTVAIHGESGAGKELVARALHQLSNRSQKPFVAINCGGIPENLLESELFGHKKGAFTGAIEEKEGLFVAANGGTIFLDEIGEMPLQLQVKLLRVLDDNLVTPVGGTASIKVDVRIISATNRDLEEMSDQGDFRKDLYYRLNVIPVFVPPLRRRKDDIPLLTQSFITQHSKSMGREGITINSEALEAMQKYPWPGNVRELKNVIERAVALCATNCIGVDDLPVNIKEFNAQKDKVSEDDEDGFGIPDQLPTGGLNLEQLIADTEISLITQALEKSRYSQKKAAELLGLTPRSLRYRLQKYGLEAQ